MKLWTPRGIAGASVLLGYPGAVVLAALNWRRIGRTRKAIVHMVVMIAGTLALFILNVGLIGLTVGIAVGYYLYRVQRSDQSPLIAAGRVAERNGLAGAVLAIVGTILIAGSSDAVARVVGAGAVAHRGDVLFGSRGGVDGCTPAGQTSMFAISDPIYLVAIMRETVQPGSRVVYEIDGPGATTGQIPVTVPPPFDCIYTTESIGPLDPGSFVVRYRYDGQPATADLAKGTFTVTAGPRGSPTSRVESTALAASTASAAPRVSGQPILAYQVTLCAIAVGASPAPRSPTATPSCGSGRPSSPSSMTTG